MKLGVRVYRKCYGDIKYEIVDHNNSVRMVEKNELINAIRNNNIRVSNLVLTNDGRLIDKRKVKNITEDYVWNVIDKVRREGKGIRRATYLLEKFLDSKLNEDDAIKFCNIAVKLMQDIRYGSKSDELWSALDDSIGDMSDNAFTDCCHAIMYLGKNTYYGLKNGEYDRVLKRKSKDIDRNMLRAELFGYALDRYYIR